MLNKKTPILILGFGSIGKRHFRNLKSMGYTNVAVYDPVDAAFEGMDGVVRQTSLAKKELQKFQIAFICTPNNRHIENAMACADAGCHLFVEKPLSHTLDGVTKLEAKCRRSHLITMVGCNMRYHPALALMKKTIDAGRLGKVYSIRHEFGYYLPSWRPTQDYRKNYAAKRSTGGGIILDDIHEFDLLFWLNGFSPVVQKNLMADHVSDLEIETEDMCLATYRFRNGVLGSVSCDYLQRSYTRTCRIIGEKGNLRWDFQDNIVWMDTATAHKQLANFGQIDFNTLYIDEIKHFFSCVEKRVPTDNPIALAAVTLTHISS